MNTARFITLSILAAAAVCGCEASIGKPSHEGRVVTRRTEIISHEPEQAAYREPVRTEDRLGYQERLPRDAVRVGERESRGGDDGLLYQPRRTGWIYVVNEDTGRTIYAGQLFSDQRFFLNLDRGQATIDGQIVLDDLSRRDRYQLYFLPG